LARYYLEAEVTKIAEATGEVARVVGVDNAIATR
jgi:hypothetical protein